ncbi:MAG: hypothetical protein F4151_12220 [Gammaproteobacteria bacterium]|nr:hypothetical protein [Gammaproteobacteria bacterium]
MRDKTRRYENHVQKGTVRVDSYDEWWLLLVDKTGSFFLSDREKQEIRDALAPTPPWSKIVVIDQHTGRRLVSSEAEGARARRCP